VGIEIRNKERTPSLNRRRLAPPTASVSDHHHAAAGGCAHSLSLLSPDQANLIRLPEPSYVARALTITFHVSLIQLSPDIVAHASRYSVGVGVETNSPKSSESPRAFKVVVGGRAQSLTRATTTARGHIQYSRARPGNPLILSVQ
jgi:hypothetical protein